MTCSNLAIKWKQYLLNTEPSVDGVNAGNYPAPFLGISPGAVYVGRAKNAGSLGVARVMINTLIIPIYIGTYLFTGSGEIVSFLDAEYLSTTGCTCSWVSSSSGAVVANAVTVTTAIETVYVARLATSSYFYLGHVSLSTKKFSYINLSNVLSTSTNYQVLRCT